MTTTQRSEQATRAILAALVAAPLMLTGVASAQTLTSTAELKLACETSPGNVVQINVNTQISTGPQAPFTETVLTGCTLVVAPLVTFEAGQVSMTFRGPLVIRGGQESRALFVESAFTAPSITVTQPDKSLFLTDHSLLRATTGRIAISAGNESIVDVHGTILGGNLVAAGPVSVALGAKSAAFLTDAAVQAGRNISVTMVGDETQFISTTSTLNTTGGAILVTGSGAKSLAEFKLGSVAAARSGVTVQLGGNETVLNGSEFTFNGGTGAVTLVGGGTKSAVTLAVGSITAGTTATVRASTVGTLGEVLLQNATVSAAGAVRIESGAQGKTTAKDDAITSATLIRIASGPGGFCESLGNTLTAPVQQICP